MRDENGLTHAPLLGLDRVKVMCTECKQTFPAFVSRLDVNSDLPQMYNQCPYCKHRTKVRIARGW